jgi:acyl-CoA thioesterase-1
MNLCRTLAPHRLLRNLITGIFLVALHGCGSDLPRLSPLAGEAKILAFGDSLTKGTGGNREQSYPAILSRLIGRDVINAGVPGELSADGLKRLPQLLAAIRPQLMILCHGGNDMLRRKDLTAAARNIESMIRLARTQHVEVLLVGVPKPGLLLSTADIYSDIAEAAGIPAELDVVTEILSDQSLKSDPVHPNGKGYERMAEKIHAILKDTGAL